MAQITELKHEDQSRRRTSRTAAVLGGVVVVAGAGWLAFTQLGGSGDVAPQPMSSRDVVVTAPPTLTPGQLVGANLLVPLKAKAPAEWTVFSDGGIVWLDSDGEAGGPSVEIAGPVLAVYPEGGGGTRSATAMGSDGCLEIAGPSCVTYDDWLWQHTSLSYDRSGMMTDARSPVTVDGQTAKKLTLEVGAEAPVVPGYGGVLLAKFDGIDSGQPWDEVQRGEKFTEVVVDVNGSTMVVKASGATSSAEQAELDEALDMVLSTMKLPN